MLQLAGSGTPGITPPDEVDVVEVPPEELGSPVDVSPPDVDVEVLVVVVSPPDVEVVELLVVVVSPPLVEVVLVVPPVVVEAVPPVDVLLVGQVIVAPFGPAIVPPAGGQVAVWPPPLDPPPPPPRIVPLGLGTSLNGACADEPPPALAPLACPDRAPTTGGVASLNANSCDADGRLPRVGVVATGTRRLVLITGTPPERRSGAPLA